MAEFKLGRIRFVWQGDWTADTAYVADDVVSFGGKSYICIKNHTASAEFNTDFTDAIPKWEIVSDGTSWKGLWEPEVEYAPGDVVKYGANVYICEDGHTSATYASPDYLGLEENIDHWTPFATSFDWKSSWTVNTRYKLNDLVRYGAYVYVCNTAHVSAATTALGLEADNSKWTLFSDGVVYRGEWTTTTRYRVNDLVKYGGNIWIATAAHTSTDFESDEAANWDSFIEGFQFEDSWNSGANYQIGDTVTYGGYIYVAKTNNTNSQPTSNPADWDVFTTGFKFQGEWSVLTDYKVGDVIRLSGNTYVATSDNTGNEPPNGTYWSLLNSGINWANSTKTFLQVSGVNVEGSGSGARFDVTKSKTVYTVSVSTGFAGTGYAEDDIITISGANVGGLTPANDITVTVTGVTGGAIDTVSYVGNSTTWKSGTDYHTGDVVLFGANSYICVTKHTAATGNRPDNDLAADYWNLLTLGSEALALTTEGDMVYYGETGPTRLPVGIDGQILRATDGIPSWANYGLIDNVVYVGPLGTNEPAPAAGLTVDKPWGSVRYALEQVRDGYLNPQTRDILKNNKEFFMKEVTNWISYHYRVNITEATNGTEVFTCTTTENLAVGMPIEFNGTLGGVVEGTTYYVHSIPSATTFIISATLGGVPKTLTSGTGIMEGNLSYDQTFCERDTGYIVDALIYDISKGGTLKTVRAANAYYTPAGNEYINSNFGTQGTQTVEAYNYLKEIVLTVLNNEQPLNYQSLNGIAIEDRASQVIDFTLEAEQTGIDKVTTLINIVTTGIAAGSATAIPTATNPNTTVFIKTGTYNEVLPIVVPEYTAIVGDELRTSVVQPQPAIPLLANDKNKTTGALNRIKSLIPDLMQNIEVTVSDGNTAEQQYINGYGGTTTATNRLNTGIELMQDVLEQGLDFAEEHGTDPGTTPTGGSDNAYTVGYANAVAQLEANKAFIQDEITSWIQDQIDGPVAPFTGAFTYDVDACNRDVGYIVDALVYDLTYGGNLETTVAARSYFAEGSPVYGAGEKDEVLASYARLKTIVGEIILETDVTTSSGTTILQDKSNDAGSVSAQTQAEALVQEIYDTIDTDGTLASEDAPDITWIPTTLTTVNTAFVNEKSTLQESVIDYINSNYGTFIYDSAKCRRDSRLLQTGAAYDIALDTNYNAVRDGLSYRRGMAEKVLDEQLTETVGAITEEGSLVEALMSDATAITRNTAYWAEVIDIIQNGEASADTITYANTGVAAKTTARTEIQTDRATIISDLTTWIGTTYPSLNYTEELCERDTGYILDAISYDINYGGNSATIEAARAYYNGTIEVLPENQREETAAAINQLSTIVQGYLSGPTEQTEADTLLQIIVNVVTAGDLITLPTKTYPSYAWAAAGIGADADAILADTTVVPAVLQYITDNYSGFIYDHTKCSRDIGYIIDALRYDIMFGSDFRSLKAGMAYRRGLASTGVVLDEQLEATIGSLDHLRSQLKEITTGTSKVIESTDIIKDILVNATVPSSFTFSDPTGYDTGFYNARRLIVANKQFLIDEVEAYMADNYGVLWASLSAGDKAACLRDMGYIVDALQYDLTYRGNLETIVAARSYYVDGVFVEPSDQKTAALGVQARLAVMIGFIATGDDDPGSWTKSVSNSSTQDTTGTAGSAGAAAFATDRINEIYNTIDTGDSPALISPSTAWVDNALVDLKAVIDSRRAIIQSGAINYINFMFPDLTYDQDKCSRDVGYMVDAIVYDVIFGSDFRSSKAGMSYRRGLISTGVVIDDQLEATVATIDYINEALTSITKGVEGSVGTTAGATRAVQRADVIKDVIQNGLAAIPAYNLTPFLNYNTSDLVHTAYATASNPTGDTSTYGNAADQLTANSAFIQLEVRKWLEDNNNGYDTFWATLSSDAQDRCIRDVGYIIDAIRYDLTYGGNTQSLVAGSAYYSNFVLTIGADELPATLAAYARMKDVIGWVIGEVGSPTWTKSPGNILTQDTTGTPGNAASIEFAEDRVDDILDWINNGFANATIEVATDLGDEAYQASYANLVARKNEIVEDVVSWVEKYWQSISYNQTTCRRDAGLMVDAIARDVVTGSNFASIKAGMSYYRALSSTAEVINNEFEATIGSVNFLKQKVKHVAAVTASAHAEVIIDDIVGYINGGAKPTLKWKTTDATDANDVAAATIIWENKEFVKAEIYEFITQNYLDIEYSQEKCLRDVGYIIDALRYDLTYGGDVASIEAALTYYLNTTLQIDGNDHEATLASYDYMKFIVMELAVNQFNSPGALQTEVEPIFKDDLQTVGDSASQDRVEELMTLMYNIIRDGDSSVPTITVIDSTSNVLTTSAVHGLKVGDQLTFTTMWSDLDETQTYYVKTVPTTTSLTISSFYGGSEYAISDTTTSVTVQVKHEVDYSSISSTLTQQFTNIQGSKSAIQTSIEEFINDNYPTLEYDNDKCTRDVGLIVDAVCNDMVSDSNYRTFVAAMSYYRGTQANEVLTDEKNATVQSYREMKNLMTNYITSTDGVATKRVNNLMDIIINILDQGEGETPEINGTVTYYNDVPTIAGTNILKANKTFLANEATAWVTNNFGGTVSSLGSPTITFSAVHNLIVGDPITFDAAVGSLTADTTYYVVEVPSTSSIKVAATLGGTAIAFTGTLSGSPVATYVFDETSCQRDMVRYIEALAYDLQYPGNYKSWRAAQLYLNAVQGSERSDMFYVRNSTGVRNQTLNGLRGNLTELNDFGTRRPTAGAYVSLDPGFGPQDSEAWIDTKSPYSQNVTTFGVGCVGGKIDGALHAGGNRSMVANDFTQVLSDGIGIWCSGNNSLVELVSVFCYYNYSGYIADFGGRIRATNGNSSYGTWGVIAEGTDTGEIPLYAEVDNHSQDAYATEVLTDGEEVLRFEFANAGRNYTNVEWAISGTGFNAATVGDEFRDAGIFETRLVDLDDGNGVGGEEYVEARNVAQGGDEVSITIAATDTALANAYNGMRVQCTVGTGVGQYANVLRYNNGQKVATVYRDSFNNLTATATSATGNVITVSDTTEMYVDMPVYFDADIGGLNEGNSPTDVYYVTTIPSSTTFTVSDSVGGADITLTNTSGQSVTVYAAGWDNVIPGKPIEATLDLTTGYVIEPRIDHTAPGETAVATTTAGSSKYASAAYAGGRFVTVNNGTNGTEYSEDGITWAAGGSLPSSVDWVDVVFGGGQGASAYAVVGGLGGQGAVLEAELGELNSIGLPGPTQIARINVIDGGTGYTTPPTITITPTAGGGAASAVATVLDGVIQEVIVVTTGAGYGAAPTVTAETDKITEIVVTNAGNGYKSTPTVTLTGGGASTQATVSATLNNEGVSTITIDLDGDDEPLNGDGYTSAPTVEIVDSDAQFVAIANGSQANAHLALDSDPTDNWTAGSGNLPNSNFVSLTYGDGVYVAVGGSSPGGAGCAATSTDGSAWTTRTNIALAAGSFTGVAYGAGSYVCIASGTNLTGTSTNGITWVPGGNMPASTTWESVAFGNGRFVAIASGGTSAAYSYDNGVNWYASPNGLPSTQNWSTVKYGQGLFVATALGTDEYAYSFDGVYWHAGTLTSSNDWKALVFGNPDNNPIWVALSDALDNEASVIYTGAKAMSRTTVTDGALSIVRMAEPGSGYPKGTVVSATAPGTITLSTSYNLLPNQPITFTGCEDAGLEDGVVYYIANDYVSGNDISVSLIQDSGTDLTIETATFSGATYKAGPITTITDTNSTVTAPVVARQGDGVVANPTFTNRGTGFETATVEGAGDGFADLYQPSTFVAVRGLFDLPEPGSNVVFDNIPGTWYKLVAVNNILGSDGNYQATFQLSPSLTVLNAPADSVNITTTNKYSQVRLTGHDFLYIGTGNQADTNYPYVDITTASVDKQQLGSGGGRVFFTSTDQDGNFNVGNLFGVQQSTGTATLDADAFNLAGLQSLQLQGIGLGIGSAIITQFSTDPFFTANSDSIVPTQRAIKSYITAQIGGGQSSLNVNTLTAGVVYIANDEITTTSGGQLNIKAKMNFTGGVDGAPVALGFFLQR